MTLTAREQLSLLLGRAASLAITEREAQERLQKTMNALVFFQLNVRLWVRRMRRRRAAFKVTMRTELGYASSHPLSAEQTALRKIRVREHGWRSGMRYQPLGDPKLHLEKKPGEASLRPAVDEAVSEARESFVFLGHGESAYGKVAPRAYAYFQTYLSDPKASLLVTVEALGGDPDLFMSRDDTHPTAASATWASADLGADAINVAPSDPHHGVGHYHIAVYAGDAGAECRFKVTVYLRRGGGGNGGSGSSSAMAKQPSSAGGDARGKEMRQHIAAAERRRRRVMKGASAGALMAEAGHLTGGPQSSGRTPQQRLDALVDLPRDRPPARAAAAEAVHVLTPALAQRLPFALAAGSGGAPVQVGVAALSTEWLVAVLSHAVALRTLGPGEKLWSAGEAAGSVGIVTRGEVRVATDVSLAAVAAAASAELEIPEFGGAAAPRRLAPGDCVGEEPLLGRGARRPRTVVAGGAGAEVALLRYDALLRLQEMEAEAAEVVLRLLAVCSPAHPTLGDAATAAAAVGAAAADRPARRSSLAPPPRSARRTRQPCLRPPASRSASTSLSGLHPCDRVAPSTPTPTLPSRRRRAATAADDPRRTSLQSPWRPPPRAAPRRRAAAAATAAAAAAAATTTACRRPAAAAGVVDAGAPARRRAPRRAAGGVGGADDAHAVARAVGGAGARVSRAGVGAAAAVGGAAAD